MTAEALMRSRYTAHVVGDVAHLATSWDPSTRPPHVDVDAATRWLGLVVHTRTGGGLADDRGTVGYTATSDRGALEELAAFRRLAGRWVYVGPAST